MDDLVGKLSTSEGTFDVVIRRAVAAERPARTRRSAFPKTTREHLLRVQRHKCAICRGPLSYYESHIDHIIPVKTGGSDDFANLQLTHMNCNLRKGAGRGPHDRDQERMPWA